MNRIAKNTFPGIINHRQYCNAGISCTRAAATVIHIQATRSATESTGVAYT